ncbi:MAG: hypothetical protein AAGB11_02370 [Pseudomonadota bacterium]
MTRRLLGVTVLPEWVQAEGVEAVLDRLEGAGVNAVATSPYVMEPTGEDEGSREPPADADAGKVRLLDRPLWGERALFVRTAPSFVPEKSRYAGLFYQPPEPDGLTARAGHLVARFLAAAKGRGMTTHLQVQAAIPPGYRVQFGGPRAADQPLGPDGKPVDGRVDANASLASKEILAYGEALLGDLAAQYEVDAIRIDWPEIPPYAFGALFFDFSDHAMRAASEKGLDTGRMRADVAALKSSLAQLTDAELDAATPELLDAALAARPGVIDCLALRCHFVEDLLTRYRAALPASVGLVPQVFPPPFNRLSGFDYAAAAKMSAVIGVKLYTMHWPMILRNWGDALAKLAPQASEGSIARALVRLAGTGDPTPAGITHLNYPEPDEPHPASDAALEQKILLARSEANGATIAAFSHAYGPIGDVVRRLRAAWRASGGQVWINRYGYLSDEKLAALPEATS